MRASNVRVSTGAHRGVWSCQIHILVSAFDKAWEAIQTSGAKFDTGAHAEHARATLAKHIIEAAKQGELDQRRLRDGALCT